MDFCRLAAFVQCSQSLWLTSSSSQLLPLWILFWLAPALLICHFRGLVSPLTSPPPGARWAPTGWRRCSDPGPGWTAGSGSSCWSTCRPTHPAPEPRRSTPWWPHLVAAENRDNRERTQWRHPAGGDTKNKKQNMETHTQTLGCVLSREDTPLVLHVTQRDSRAERPQRIQAHAVSL